VKVFEQIFEPDRDKYGATLVYIYLPDNSMWQPKLPPAPKVILLNAEIVRHSSQV